MTKTTTDFSKELDGLIEHNYYSEERELRSSMGVYYGALSEEERVVFDAMFVERMQSDPSVANISISTVFMIPEVSGMIAAQLNRHKKASCITRTMMYALRPYADEVAFTAVERFVDSEHEIEALRILGSMNFVRAIPHFRRALKRDHLLEVCLHIFQDRKRAVDLETLIADLSMLIRGREGYYRRRIEAMLGIKKGDHAPFSAREMQRIITEI